MDTRARTYVVGTAGHVDHGKSSLVTRLTGIDPDRLQEEKERELTIDLGFAWLELPGGQTISIVDVPGHERFIKNMLAGVGGIDAALLVVAADEGPMPQTLEHLAILDLLEIGTGVVALTKRDLVDDDWLELVTEETRDVLAGTVLEQAPIVAVSSTTGAGVEDLVRRLEEALAHASDSARSGRARLPVDRVFSVAGFGTVVTGTLAGEALSIGQEVELLPSGRRGRVRGLQTHGAAVEQAVPGSRVAVNVTGVDRDEVQRGDLLTVPGWVQPTMMLDAFLRLTASAPRPLEQNDPVDFFVGASERAAHVTLLDANELAPGQEGWVQIRFTEALPVVDGDLFIVRQASPSLTIGGGRVVNAHPRRHRRFRDEVISELDTRLSGTPVDLLAQQVAEGPLTLGQACTALDFDGEAGIAAATEAIEDGRIRPIGGSANGALTERTALIDVRQYQQVSEQVQRLISRYHSQNPLRRGMSREEVRSRSGFDARYFDQLVQSLDEDDIVRDRGDAIALPSFEVRLTEQQQEVTNRYLNALQEDPYSPPAPDDFGLDRELLGVLQERGDLVQLGGNVVFNATVLDRIRTETLAMIERDGSITLAGFRDHFGTSRKYAQAVLEYFDEQRVTRRSGDERVRGNA